MSKFKAALFFWLASASAFASEPMITWHGNTFREVMLLADIPAPVREALGASEAGWAGVAEKGQPFNATDLLAGTAPGRRFLAAAREGDMWLIALEHGGRGYNVQAYLFSGNGTLQQHWVLPGRPQTLQDVLTQIPENQPRK